LNNELQGLMIKTYKVVLICNVTAILPEVST